MKYSLKYSRSTSSPYISKVFQTLPRSQFEGLLNYMFMQSHSKGRNSLVPKSALVTQLLRQNTQCLRLMRKNFFSLIFHRSFSSQLDGSKKHQQVTSGGSRLHILSVGSIHIHYLHPELYQTNLQTNKVIIHIQYHTLQSPSSQKIPIYDHMRTWRTSSHQSNCLKVI